MDLIWFRHTQTWHEYKFLRFIVLVLMKAVYVHELGSLCVWLSGENKDYHTGTAHGHCGISSPQSTICPQMINTGAISRQRRSNDWPSSPKCEQHTTLLPLCISTHPPLLLLTLFIIFFPSTIFSFLFHSPVFLFPFPFPLPHVSLPLLFPVHYFTLHSYSLANILKVI